MLSREPVRTRMLCPTTVLYMSMANHTEKLEECKCKQAYVCRICTMKTAMHMPSRSRKKVSVMMSCCNVVCYAKVKEEKEAHMSLVIISMLKH